MPKFAANLTMLFTEVYFLQRFALAAQSGFKGVEYLFPYDFDKKQLKELLLQYQLTQVLHNLPAGNWAAGERGIACHHDRIDEFKAGVAMAIEYATTLNCKQVNVLAGIFNPEHEDPKLAELTFIANIQYAADELKRHGINLLIEAINSYDIANFYVTTTKQVLYLINKAGRDNIFVQYDIYHMQRMEGDLCHTIKNNLAMIKHLQLADNPGRFQPGTGEINYPFIFNYLDQIGYQGWIGCEYNPKTTTKESLDWLLN